MRRHFPALVLGVALIASMAKADADPPPLSEREAVELGERLLREQRWPEAIAAFAESDKNFPTAAFEETQDDPRSRHLVDALDKILAELEAQHAPAARRLPYWDFYVRNYPFFSTDIEQYNQVPAALQRFSLAAAIERQREADPQGDDPRFDLCRKVADLADVSDDTGLLALLDKGWPAEHPDFDACAARIGHCFSAKVRPGGGWTRDEKYLQRVWPSYAARFAASPYFGVVVSLWRMDEADLSRIQDPHALRLCLLSNPRYRGESDDAGEYFRKLVDCSGPWLSAELGEVWTIRAYQSLEESSPRRQEGLRRLNAMAQGRPRSLEFGLAMYGLYQSSSEGGNWRSLEEWYERTFTEWGRVSPDDPYRFAAMLEVVCHRQEESSPEPLTAEDRRTAQEIVARFPTEPMGALAETVLMEDALRRGRPEEALEHARGAAAFEPGAARLHAPAVSLWSLNAAHVNMLEYYDHHDPAKAAQRREELSRTEPIFQMVGGYCTEWQNLRSAAMHWRRDAARCRRSGRVEDALQAYEGFLFQENWSPAGGDLGFATDYAALCVLERCPERMERTAERLASLYRMRRQYGEVPSSRDLYGYYARELGRFQNELGRIEGGGVEVALADLAATSSNKMDINRLFWLGEDPGLGRVLAAIRCGTDRDARYRAGYALPATVASTLLAWTGDSDPSIEYLLDVFESTAENDPRHEIALRGLPAREGVAGRVMQRIAAHGVSLWPTFAPLMDLLGAEERWNTFRSIRGTEDAALRDLAEMELQCLRVDHPWTVFCLEGK